MRKLAKRKGVWQPFLQQQQQENGVQGGRRPGAPAPPSDDPGDPGAPTPYSVLSIDLGEYDTISLIEAFKIRYAVPSFIRDTFFMGREYPMADVVQIDTKRGGRSLAPFILDYEGQIVERRRPFQRTFIPAPIIAPARVITLRDANRGGWGENQYNFKTPEQRVAEIVSDDTEEMDDEIARTEEWMCAETMFNGLFTINYRNKTSVTIDYGFLNTVAVATPWSNAVGAGPNTSTANPLADLQAAQAALNQNGYAGNVAIYSAKAWNDLWTNPQVRLLMNNMNANLGGPITQYSLPEALPAGVQRAPGFTYPIMENWIYSGIYSRAGLPVPYVPPGRVLLGSRNVKNRIAYGLVTQVEDDKQFHSYSLDRVPKMEANVNKNFFMLTITSRPIPIPIDMMSWAVMTGV
jgi:Phage major capsid protein E